MKRRKKPVPDPKPNYGTPGLLYGLTVGIVFGMCLCTFLPVWVLPIFTALGLLLGLAVGSSLKKPTPPTDNDDNVAERHGGK